MGDLLGCSHFDLYTSSILPRGEGGAKYLGTTTTTKRERELYSFIRLVAAAGSFLSFIRDVTDEKEKGGETHKQPFYFLTCYGIRKGFR